MMRESIESVAFDTVGQSDRHTDGMHAETSDINRMSLCAYLNFATVCIYNYLCQRKDYGNPKLIYDVTHEL